MEQGFLWGFVGDLWGLQASYGLGLRSTGFAGLVGSTVENRARLQQTAILEGSWAAKSRVRRTPSRVIARKKYGYLTCNPLITTHEPPSRGIWLAKTPEGSKGSENLLEVGIHPGPTPPTLNPKP